MHIDIHGYPVAAGVICFVAGALLWRYKRFHRLSGLGFGLGAVLLAIGVVPWLDALAALTASGTGSVVLLVIDFVAGTGFVFEVLMKHQHHRLRTPVLTIAFGTSLVVTIGTAARLLREAARSPGKTTAALSQSVTQIRDGQAAHAMDGHQALVILVIAAAVLVLLIAGAHRMEKRTGPARSIPGRGNASRRTGGGRPMLTPRGGR
jgi:hypothetical protein